MTAQRPTTTVYIATSLDGFIARPNGSFDWLGEPEEGEDYGWAEFIAKVDVIVMGRHTFETVLPFDIWPYEGTPVVVLSSTMQDVPEHLSGKAEVMSLEPAALLDELGGRGWGFVYVDGGQTIQTFLRAGLMDELVITRIPVLIGQGIPLFGPLERDIRWTHVSTEVLGDGLVKTRYRKAARDA